MNLYYGPSCMHRHIQILFLKMVFENAVSRLRNLELRRAKSNAKSNEIFTRENQENVQFSLNQNESLVSQNNVI